MDQKLKNHLVSLNFEDINSIVEETIEDWDDDGCPEEFPYECLDGHIKESVLAKELNAELEEAYNNLPKEEKEECFDYVKAKCLKYEESIDLIQKMEEGAIKVARKPRLKLSGQNGNAFVILGKAQNEAKKANWSEQQIEEFMNEAKSSDYDHLLQTCCKYFDVA